MKPFVPEVAELLDHETDVIDKIAEREVTNKLRNDFFKRKVREAKEREQLEKEEALERSHIINSTGEKGDSGKKDALANITFDFKGKPITMRAAHLAQLNTNQNVISYDLTP